MPPSVHSASLHGSKVQPAATALLLIDVINSFDFPGADDLLEQSRPVFKEIAALRRATRRQRFPVIYANDNFGRWRSQFTEVVDFCRQQAGGALVRTLEPARTDYFVLKPKNSAFFATPLHLLLEQIGVRRLIITGLTAENCVLFTAQDAYLRDYQLAVPQDCVASEKAEYTVDALQQMQRVLKADIRPWRSSLKERHKKDRKTRRNLI
jgi:nicotinamidase-related amidase